MVTKGETEVLKDSLAYRQNLKKEVFALLKQVRKETSQDIRHFKIDLRKWYRPVHWIEYRAFEPAWQPRVFNVTLEEAKNYLKEILDFCRKTKIVTQNEKLEQIKSTVDTPPQIHDLAEKILITNNADLSVNTWKWKVVSELMYYQFLN
jgi:hypothetical protein